MGATQGNEMLPSLLAKNLKPLLSTIQPQPITVGANNPSEGLSALPIIPPLALRDTLATPAPGSALAGLETLHTLRDTTVQSLYGLYQTATKPQQAYIEALLLSQSQARSVSQSLLDTLSSIADNSVASQITAAIALVRMAVTPVIAIHIPFGGDNRDPGLAIEASADADRASPASHHPSGGSTPRCFRRRRQKVSRTLVTFISLNVFGRTMSTTANDNSVGRGHNASHQVSITIGNTLRPGVIGGIAQLTSGATIGEYGAQAIDLGGNVTTSGGIAPAQSLASFGQTILASAGVDDTTITTAVTSGQIVKGALVT